MKKFSDDLRYATLPYPSLCYSPLLYPRLPNPMLPYPTIPSLHLYPTMPYITLPYPTLRYSPLPYPSQPLLPYSTIPSLHLYPTIPYPTPPDPIQPHPTPPQHHHHHHHHHHHIRFSARFLLPRVELFDKSSSKTSSPRKLNVVAQKRSGRPRKSWDKVIKNDRKKLDMDSADPHNRSEWRGRLRGRLVKKPNPR